MVIYIFVFLGYRELEHILDFLLLEDKKILRRIIEYHVKSTTFDILTENDIDIIFIIDPKYLKTKYPDFFYYGTLL